MLRIATLLLLYLSFANGAETNETNTKPITLVLGGNGFIGSEITQWLIKRGHKIYSMSRGRWYYDTDTIINPHQTHINCERDDGIVRCEEMEELIKATPKFDYIVDLSCFGPEDLDFTLDGFRGLEDKIGVYIYISTDSIYEVCDPRFTKPPIKESAAIRPTDPKLRSIYHKEDTYGDNKLAVEEILKKQQENGGFDYVFFRLPDVFGPRDTSYRFWNYQLWLKYYKYIHVPIFTPKFMEKFRSTYAYVSDVAQAVIKVMEIGKPAHNDVYNLGFDEGITQKDLITAISEALDIKFTRFEYRDEKYTSFYPSVTRGWLDITKAKQKLGFKATDFKKAVKETAAFYERAFFEIPKERERALSQFIKQVVPPNNRQYFLNQMKKLVEEHEIQATKLDPEAHTSRTDL